MLKYFIKTPGWLKKIFPHRIWHIDTDDKILYLTFDDGPHPSITAFVLDELKKYNAKATFFCIGKNVEANAEIYNQILQDGHRVGNHTHNHLNGWKTKDDLYLKDIALADRFIQSDLFRPPYGRLKSSQARKMTNLKIVMWDVLSGDFDKNTSKDQCLQNVLKNAGPGSVIVFHDSEKASENLLFTLPKVLDFFSRAGYTFLPIP
ncbi:MAG TPA: polysaccharide deacetylase family protein [Chitinophagaceae bacterium]|nr:polysaccharide deacetylase family protein [Chitinophagaceae bacterium]